MDGSRRRSLWSTSEVSFFLSLLLNCISPPLSNFVTLFWVEPLLSGRSRELLVKVLVMNAGILHVGVSVALVGICVRELHFQDLSLQVFRISVFIKELVESLFLVCVNMIHPGSNVPLRELVLVPRLL